MKSQIAMLRLPYQCRTLSTERSASPLTAAHQCLHWFHLDPVILRSYIAHCEQITTEEYDNNTLIDPAALLEMWLNSQDAEDAVICSNPSGNSHNLFSSSFYLLFWCTLHAMCCVVMKKCIT